MRWLYIILASLVGAAKIWGDAGEWNWFLHGYAWDVALPVLVYFFVQQVLEQEGGWALALLTLVINSAGEFLQLFLESQTFDPWDFVAYSAGAGIALLLDAITPGRSTQAEPRSEEDPRE